MASTDGLSILWALSALIYAADAGMSAVVGSWLTAAMCGAFAVACLCLSFWYAGVFG